MRVRSHDFNASDASDYQGYTKDPTSGLMVPSDLVRGLTSDDASVTITDNGDGTLDLAATGSGGGTVDSVVAGTGISVDSTDPANPIVSLSGGGAGGWDNSLSLPLTTLTDWTAGAGTWTASAAGIRQSNAAGGIKRLWYGPQIRQAECVVEVEVNVATSGTGTRAGLTVSAPRADNNGGHGVWLRQSTATAQTDKVDFEKDGITYMGALNLPSAIANGTWIALRVHRSGSAVEAYVNGTLVGGSNCAVDSLFTTIHLHSNGTDATFRNLNIWSPTLP